MKLCPDCKHQNVGTVYCTHCGADLHRRARKLGAIERFAASLDRVMSNSVYR